MSKENVKDEHDTESRNSNTLYVKAFFINIFFMIAMYFATSPENLKIAEGFLGYSLKDDLVTIFGVTWLLMNIPFIIASFTAPEK